jgi:hypothetical protein
MDARGHRPSLTEGPQQKFRVDRPQTSLLEMPLRMGEDIARARMPPRTMTKPPSFTVSDGMGDWTVEHTIAEAVTLIVECLDCPYQIVWRPETLRRLFGGVMSATLADVAGRAKCSQCGSRHVRLWRAAPGFVEPDST